METRSALHSSRSPAPKSHESQRGVIVVLVAVLLTVLVGMVGLALDAGALYATKQRAQSAADAAAQAGAMDMFNRSSGTAISTAYAYGEMNGFAQGEINVSTSLNCSDQPWCTGHVILSGNDHPNLIEVTISRKVNTTFLRVLGTAATTVTAVADAAIVLSPAPVPIVVTHPTLAGAFSLGGNTIVQVCGGSARSIQVNSSSSGALSVGGGGTVDLHKAGPADDGNCNTGTGADFAALGGPSYTGFPGWLSPLGSTEHFWHPASIIYDPLSSVAAPTAPPAPQFQPQDIPNGTSGCPPNPKKGCQMYWPGTYPSGINVQNATAVFRPGLYYMDNGGGFHANSNGSMVMCTTCAPDSSINPNEPAMVVYNHGGGTFDVGSNGDATLVGADPNSVYKGILFFEDRTAPSATHSLGGNGALSLRGTLYMTNCDSTDGNCVGASMSSSQYQTLRVTGGACSSTQIRGETIVSVLDLRGGGCIVMSLSPALLPNIRSVALVR